jgi:hypothetical protein
MGEILSLRWRSPIVSWAKSGRLCFSQRSGLEKRNGRHEETRTPDLYRVNFEVLNLKPFSSLAFPISPCPKTPVKRPSFGDELVTRLSSVSAV